MFSKFNNLMLLALLVASFAIVSGCKSSPFGKKLPAPSPATFNSTAYDRAPYDSAAYDDENSGGSSGGSCCEDSGVKSGAKSGGSCCG